MSEIDGAFTISSVWSSACPFKIELTISSSTGSSLVQRAASTSSTLCPKICHLSFICLFHRLPPGSWNPARRKQCFIVVLHFFFFIMEVLPSSLTRPFRDFAFRDPNYRYTPVSNSGELFRDHA